MLFCPYITVVVAGGTAKSPCPLQTLRTAPSYASVSPLPNPAAYFWVKKDPTCRRPGNWLCTHHILRFFLEKRTEQETRRRRASGSWRVKWCKMDKEMQKGWQASSASAEQWKGQGASQRMHLEQQKATPAPRCCSQPMGYAAQSSWNWKTPNPVYNFILHMEKVITRTA